jgi:hypothetical protein
MHYLHHPGVHSLSNLSGEPLLFLRVPETFQVTVSRVFRFRIDHDDKDTFAFIIDNSFLVSDLRSTRRCYASLRPSFRWVSGAVGRFLGRRLAFVNQEWRRNSRS